MPDHGFTGDAPEAVMLLRSDVSLREVIFDGG